MGSQKGTFEKLDSIAKDVTDIKVQVGKLEQMFNTVEETFKTVNVEMTFINSRADAQQQRLLTLETDQKGMIGTVYKNGAAIALLVSLVLGLIMEMIK